MVSGEEVRMLERAQGEARRAARAMVPVPGRFVARSDESALRHVARENGVSVAVCGFWEEAERVQTCFFPEGLEPVFTAVWLHITWNTRFAFPTHRTLFGSLMGLGVDASFLGDLVMGEDCAELCCMREVAQRLCEMWTDDGHSRIVVRPWEGEPHICAPQGEQVRVTVASLRLDAVLSEAIHLSRSKGADMIRQGLVQVNHHEELRVDRILAEKDLLSVRHFGRIRVGEVGAPTRKGRYPVTLSIFASRA